MRLATIVVAVSLLLGACTGGQTDSGARELSRGLTGEGGTDTTLAGSDGGDQESPSAPEDDGGAGGFGDEGTTPVALPTNIGRDIIFTAQLTVAVNDVADAGRQATSVIQGLGGFLFGQQTSGEPDPTSVLTFKVAPDDFQTALDQLGGIGELRSQQISANDVTERVVDLESRISTATASVDRLRALLSEATDIKAIVELESELLMRETELETLRGSLRTLQDQVALATIFLTLTEADANPELTVSVTTFAGHDSGVSCPGQDAVPLERDAPATVCYEIVNTGDTWLSSFELRDPVLDVEIGDLIVVFGDVDGSLEPGDSLLLAAEIVPERDVRARTTITATAVDENGDDLGARPVSDASTLFIETFDPVGVPSFTDGLEASWDLLVRLGQTVVLAMGALIPFVWVPIVGWFLWRAAKRRDTVPVTPET